MLSDVRRSSPKGAVRTVLVGIVLMAAMGATVASGESSGTTGGNSSASPDPNKANSEVRWTIADAVVQMGSASGGAFSAQVGQGGLPSASVSPRGGNPLTYRVLNPADGSLGLNTAGCGMVDASNGTVSYVRPGRCGIRAERAASESHNGAYKDAVLEFRGPARSVSQLTYNSSGKSLTAKVAVAGDLQTEASFAREEWQTTTEDNCLVNQELATWTRSSETEWTGTVPVTWKTPNDGRCVVRLVVPADEQAPWLSGVSVSSEPIYQDTPTLAWDVGTELFSFYGTTLSAPTGSFVKDVSRFDYTPQGCEGLFIRPSGNGLYVIPGDSDCQIAVKVSNDGLKNGKKTTESMSVTKAFVVRAAVQRSVEVWTTVNGERRDWVGPQDFDSSGQLKSDVQIKYASFPSTMPSDLVSFGANSRNPDPCVLNEAAWRVTAVPNSCEVRVDWREALPYTQTDARMKLTRYSNGNEISWNPVADLSLAAGAAQLARATSSAGIPIKYLVFEVRGLGNSAGCSLNVSTMVLTYSSAGTCSVQASHDGQPPAVVTRRFTVSDRLPQTVTWGLPLQVSVSAMTPVAEGFSFTPAVWAASSGNGAITYAISDAGSSKCTLDAKNSIIVSGAGTCSVTATAARTDTFLSGSTTVLFAVLPAEPQRVTWNAGTVISSLTPSSEGGEQFTPSAGAYSSGDGAITYAVSDAGATSCRMALDGVSIVVGANGVCSVTATAAATARALSGSVTVAFKIAGFGAPRPSSPSGSGASGPGTDSGGGGGGSGSYSCTPPAYAVWGPFGWYCTI